jgi:branched-chain amino acid transport system substrate-binding protein
MSGVGAPGGHDMVSGIQVFLDENDSQIAGRKVELILEDDQHSVTYALDKMRKLVDQDGVHLLIGTISSNIAYGIAPSVKAMQIPMIFPITGADDLTKRTRYEWVIRTGFASSQYGHPFAQWVYQNLGYSNVASFGLDYALGWEIVGSFQKTLEELGGKVIQKLWASQSLVDFSSYMGQLRRTADAVFFATSNMGAEGVAKGYKKSGPGLPLIGGGPGFDETTFRDMGDTAEIISGAISVSHYSGALKNPENTRFNEAFRKRRGADVAPSLFAEGAYTAGLWAKKAIESIDGAVEDRAQLLKALKGVELNAPRGPMKLDDYGNPIQNIYVRRVERIGSALQNTVIHTTPNVSQFWTYDPVTYLKQPVYSREYPPL